MKKTFLKFTTWLKSNYMQLIFLAVVLTMFSIFSTYTFIRLGISFKAFGYSISYYFKSFASDDVVAPPTSLDLLIEYHGGSIANLIPVDFRNFFNNFKVMMNLLINKDFFSTFGGDLGHFLKSFLLIATTLLIIAIIIVGIFFFNNRYHAGEEAEDSKPLKKYKHLESKAIKFFGKIKAFLIKFFKKWLLICLAILFALYMNLGSIAMDLISNYFYLLACFDFSIIGIGLTTLALDLLPQYFSFPLIIRLIAIYVIYDIVRKFQADKRMKKLVDANKDYLKSSGNTILISGASRVGKNSLATCLTLIYGQIILPEQLLDIMLGVERKFPGCNYNKLAAFIDDRVAKNEINNQNDIYRIFYHEDLSCFFDSKQEVWDELTVECITNAVCDWALAYFFYTAKSPLSVSNYAIAFNSKINPKPHYFNVDHLNMLKEKKKDFCKRQYNKVINFDYMRLGNKFEDYESDAKYVPDVGVYNITEAGKERGSTDSIKNSNRYSDSVNKRNDKFNERLKIWSHIATIRYTTLFKLILDEQENMDINVELRRCCECILILDRNRIKKGFALKGWDIENLICKSILQIYDKYNLKRKESHLIDTSSNYMLKKIISKIDLYFHRRINKYTYQKIKLFARNGSTESVNDEVTENTLYIINKIAYSGRYETTSLKRLFLRQMAGATMRFDKMRSFQYRTPTDDDYKYMRSFFYTEIFNYKRGN